MDEDFIAVIGVVLVLLFIAAIPIVLGLAILKLWNNEHHRKKPENIADRFD